MPRQPAPLHRPLAHRRRGCLRGLPGAPPNEHGGPTQRGVCRDPRAVTRVVIVRIEIIRVFVVPVRARGLDGRQLRGPNVEPHVAGWQIHVNPRCRPVHHRRGEDVAADEELGRHVARHRVVRVVHQQRPGDRHPGQRAFSHELASVGREASVQPGECPKVVEKLGRVPGLRVVQRAVTLVRAEHRVGQGAEFHPPHEQLAGPVPTGRGRVSAHVRVRNPEAG